MPSLRLTPGARYAIHRLGGALMVLGALLVLAVTVHPCRVEIGRIVIRMHSVRNPTMLLLLGYIAWTATTEDSALWLHWPIRWLRALFNRPKEQIAIAGAGIRALGRQWTWRQWTMLVMTLAQGLAVVIFWQSYPSYLADQHQIMEEIYRRQSDDRDGKSIPILEGFCQAVSRETPSDARILFHGHTPGLRMAYELYPRRVFMLPQEMRWMAAHWHVQSSLADLPVDQQLSFWESRLPDESVDEATFIREHQITHVVTFDETSVAKCRVEPVR